MRSRFRLTLVAALVAAAGAAASCDYFLQGTYTGLCDEPKTLFGDLGDPNTVRRAQCQVENNVCCHRPVTAGSKALSTDHRTFCLQQWECYSAGEGESCLADIDCLPALECMGANEAFSVQGTCKCPGDGIYCPAAGETPAACCPHGTLCGQGSCQPPLPPEDAGMSGPVDLKGADLKPAPGA